MSWLFDSHEKPEPESRGSTTSPNPFQPFKLDEAMNGFVSAIQTDFEAGMGEIRDASAGVSSILRDIKEKVVASSARPSGQIAQSPADLEAARKRQEAKRLLQGLQLDGGKLHTCTIRAMAEGRVVGDVDDELIRIEWYRALPGGSFTAIAQVKGGVYKPSVDDIGARICLRGCLVGEHRGQEEEEEEEEEPPISIFREVGPLTVDPVVDADYLERIGGGVAMFRGLRDPRYPTRTFELMLDDKGVIVVEGVRLYGEEEEDDEEGEGRERRRAEKQGHHEEGLVGTWPYSKETRVALHAASVTVMAIEVPPPLSSSSPGGHSSRRLLVCGSKHERDVIALVWRALRKRALGGEEVDDATLQEGMDALMPSEQGTGSAEEGLVPRAPFRPPQHEGEEEDSHSNNEMEPSYATQVALNNIPSTDSQPSETAKAAGGGREEDRDSSKSKKRTVSDSLLYIDPRWRGDGTGVAAVVGPSKAQQMEVLTAGLEGYSRLEGHEKQIAQISHQLAFSTVELEHERALRAAAEERARKLATETTSLRTECVGLQSRVNYLERAAVKMTVEHSEARALADDCMAKAAALQEQLDKWELDEQALQLKVSTNEQAAVLMREELKSLMDKLDEVQLQKEKERRYFVTSLEDRDSRLEKADADIITYEGRSKEMQAQLDQALALNTLLLEEVEGLRGASDELVGVQGELAALRAELEQVQGESKGEKDALESSRSRVASLTTELETAKAKAASLLTERNSFKNRAESLSREMARVTRLGRSLEDIEELLNRLPEVEAEKKRLVEELDELRDIKGINTPLTISAIGSTDGGGSLSSAGAAAVRRGVAFFKLPSTQEGSVREQELQRVVANLTDSMHDKDLQLDTQRDMNRRLMERISRLEALLLEKGGTMSEDDDEDEEEEGSTSDKGSSRQSSLSVSGDASGGGSRST